VLRWHRGQDVLVEDNGRAADFRIAGEFGARIVNFAFDFDWSTASVSQQVSGEVIIPHCEKTARSIEAVWKLVECETNVFALCGSICIPGSAIEVRDAIDIDDTRGLKFT
jgi:hypothetical protein